MSSDIVTAQKWLAFLQCLLRSYASAAGPLLTVEREAFTPMLQCIELLCAAYFSNQGDMEGAKNALEIYGFTTKYRDEIQAVCKAV